MLNENDIQDILADVRHWLLNGANGDLSDMNTTDEQLLRVRKLNELLRLSLRQELLAYKFLK